MWQKAQESKATSTIEDFLLLAYDTSPWNSELYMTVTNEVYGIKNVKLTGTYLSKVFEGPYKNTRIWCNEMQEWVKTQGKTLKKNLIYYTTCPKCAKHYGKNHIVYFAQV